jgi:hypothetical protein
MWVEGRGWRGLGAWMGVGWLDLVGLGLTGLDAPGLSRGVWREQEGEFARHDSVLDPSRGCFTRQGFFAVFSGIKIVGAAACQQ